MTRYDFGAIAEVIDLDSRQDVIAVTRDLSVYGCFVKIRTPFPAGTEVRVRIAYAGSDFAAVGMVTDNVSSEGMGIEFFEIGPKDRAIIEAWLGVTAMGNDEGPVAQGRRLKNRLCRHEQEPRVTSIDRKPKADRPRISANGSLEPAGILWHLRNEARH